MSMDEYFSLKMYLIVWKMFYILYCFSSLLSNRLFYLWTISTVLICISLLHKFLKIVSLIQSFFFDQIIIRICDKRLTLRVGLIKCLCKWLCHICMYTEDEDYELWEITQWSIACRSWQKNWEVFVHQRTLFECQRSLYHTITFFGICDTKLVILKLHVLCPHPLVKIFLQK